ncbi:MAG: hypothetical protein CMM01_02610 [Rhodopirellula sp.]|nr:hypothetical protein [Rhodopirellula sp.]
MEDAGDDVFWPERVSKGNVCPSVLSLASICRRYWTFAFIGFDFGSRPGSFDCSGDDVKNGRFDWVPVPSPVRSQSRVASRRMLTSQKL